MLLLKMFNILSTNGCTDIPDRICHLTNVLSEAYYNMYNTLHSLKKLNPSTSIHLPVLPPLTLTITIPYHLN